MDLFRTNFNGPRPGPEPGPDAPKTKKSKGAGKFKDRARELKKMLAKKAAVPKHIRAAKRTLSSQNSASKQCHSTVLAHH